MESSIARAVRPTYTSLAEGVTSALSQDNMQLAVHLAWLLIFQPDCPLQLQTHAVLVHSFASLALGGDPEVIEKNLKSMIHRLAGGTELARLALRGQMMPWKLEAIKQLRAALDTVRLRREETTLRPSPLGPTLQDLDYVVESLKKMSVDCVPNILASASTLE